MPIPQKKIKIDGIKLSDQLLAIQLLNDTHSPGLVLHLCKRLTENKINIAFLSSSGRGDQTRCSCCVDSKDETGAKKIILSDLSLSPYITFVPEVGLLSLFPHHSSLEILGLALCAFGDSSIPLYGMASSLSSLTFMTDFALMDKAVAALVHQLAVPPEIVPFRQQVHVRQSDIPEK